MDDKNKPVEAPPPTSRQFKAPDAAGGQSPPTSGLWLPPVSLPCDCPSLQIGKRILSRKNFSFH